jgi:hypothetical protein
MRSISFLLFFFTLVIQLSPAGAYTIVLPSGKRVEGDLIGDDGATIRVRDPHEEAVSPPGEGKTAVPSAVRPTLPELARRLRLLRKGGSRVYTSADMDRLPEVEVFGSACCDGGEPAPKGVTSGRVPDERYWRTGVARLRKQVNDLREKKLRAEERSILTIRPRGGRKRILSFGGGEPVECKVLPDRQAQLRRAEYELDDFLEKARRSGVPWSWLE